MPNKCDIKFILNKKKDNIEQNLYLQIFNTQKYI